MKYDQTKKVIERDEGRRNRLYKCTAGKLTIGIGYNIEDNGLPDHIIDELFQISFDVALSDAKAYVNDSSAWEQLNETRQGVVISMAFNLGLSRLRNFKMTRKALIAGDFERAADEMLDSKWARQVGQRARHLAHIMRTGVWE